MIKQTMVSMVVFGFLLASCGGGGGGGVVDNTPTDKTPSNNSQGTIEEPSFTGDGSQTTIDNTATLSPANYVIVKFHHVVPFHSKQ